MRTVAWSTFAITLALALAHMERVSLDQPARDLSSTAARKGEAIVRSTNALDPQGIHGIDELSKAISNSSSNPSVRRY